MAIIMFEGFDNWSNGVTTPPLNSNSQQAILGGAGIFGWNNCSINSVPAGTLGGKAVQFGGGNFMLGDFPSATTLIFGFRFKPGSPLSQEIIWQFQDSAYAINAALGKTAAGKLVVTRGNFVATLGTGTTTMVAGAEYEIEIKIEFANSAVVEVRMNGVTEISLSGVDTTATANQNCARIRMDGGSYTFDDLYLLDTTGPSPYNDFLGGSGASFKPWRVETLFPTSANSTQFTPNASTNVSRVQETLYDADTTYNSDSTAGHVDTFNHGSLSSTPVTIFAVKQSMYARKEDVSIRTIRNKMISGGTTQNGTTYDSATVYQLYEDIYTADPDTSAAWGTSGVNATKIGYELVS